MEKVTNVVKYLHQNGVVHRSARNSPRHWLELAGLGNGKRLFLLLCMFLAFFEVLQLGLSVLCSLQCQCCT